MKLSINAHMWGLTYGRLRCCATNRDLEGPLDVREQLRQVRRPVNSACRAITNLLVHVSKLALQWRCIYA